MNTMREKPSVRLSVIIPVYNAEESLDACLESVWKQDFREYEVVMVDNMSSDGSWDRLCAWERRDARFRALRCGERGVSAARNAGLSCAGGEIITFIDADDRVPEGAFACAMQRLGGSRAGLFMGGTWKCMGDRREYFGLMGEAGKPCTVTLSGSDLVTYEKKTLSNGVFSGNPLNHAMTSMVWGKYYRRELVLGLSFQTNLSLGEDTVFLLDVIGRLKREGGEVLVSSDVVYCYMVGGESLATGSSNLRRRTEDLLLELDRRYGGQEEFRPFLTEKYTQQLLHFLSCSRGMRDPAVPLRRKRIFLKNMLVRDPWKRVLVPGCERGIPGNAVDRGLAFFAGRGMGAACLGWVKLRERLKRV